ncbi:hypothetical protein HK100_012260 [Physocladia obscura]|uniref:N-acetyltransferase domain-containing protein n=1 Tax=Physocladia obscura TaxID=109957 RepID=A0AAD5T8B6_9FUNG|nr:hypothetical protein HK100_012260 [Physocladia obscura]
MVKIEPITFTDADSDLAILQELHRSNGPYTTTSYYVVSASATPNSSDGNTSVPQSLTFQLSLKHNLPQKTGGNRIPDRTELELYKTFLSHSVSFKAIAADNSSKIVAMIVASIELWNKTVKVWEFIVDRRHQRSGIGQNLLDAVIRTACAKEIDRVVCETQNNNYPALQFYFKNGFSLDAVDTSFYHANDLERQDVAVFMKLKVRGKESEENETAVITSEKVPLSIDDCVNEICPNSGKPVSADSLTVYKGRIVGFCNSLCRDEFDNALAVFDTAISAKF